jgi:addiction module HigA family antidote
MPMEKPPYPGLELKKNIEALGLSIAKASESLGVTRQQLDRLVRGKTAITPEMAIRLEKAIGGTADIWLRAQLDHDLAKVRAGEGEILAAKRARRPSRTV